ncbi:MAG: WD40 repeat domain-containing protein [Verrucomicrobia subdivision 3 bacterium]|nr:WD40 repeat domain-containing protein [Limisphaerales bacterium]
MRGHIGDDGEVTLFNPVTATVCGVLAKPAPGPHLLISHFQRDIPIAFSANGRHLLVGNGSPVATAWDTANLQPVTTFTNAGPIRCAAFSPDNRLLLTAGVGPVRLWDASSFRLLRMFAESNMTCAVAFAPNARRFAAAGAAVDISLWDCNTGNRVGTLPGYRRWSNLSLAFSPVGDTLAAGSVEGSILLYDVNRLKLVRRFKGGAGPVSGVAFSPDGRLLAACGIGGTVKLWKTDAEYPVATVASGINWPISVAFSPKGDLLAVGSRERNVRLFRAADIAVLREVTSLK